MMKGTKKKKQIQYCVEIFRLSTHFIIILNQIMSFALSSIYIYFSTRTEPFNVIL